MCGRYVLRNPGSALVKLFLTLGEEAPALPHDERLAPRYNIAPTQDVPVVRNRDTDGIELAFARWGLIPHWSKDDKSGARMINARIETVGEKPAFRDALKSRRCLIPADGFIEWRREGKARLPVLFEVEDRQPFALAGIWARWRRGDVRVESCSILTTAALGAVAELHDRMPVVVPPPLYRWWLGASDASGELDRLRDMPTPFVGHPVSTRVNSPLHDDAACLAPPSG